MKKLLILLLIFICVGCSQKETKNINLVCDTHSSENTHETSTLIIKDDKGEQLSSLGLTPLLTPLTCQWSEIFVICDSDRVSIRVDRFSLVFHEGYRRSDDYNKSDSFVTYDGKCKISEKQI